MKLAAVTIASVATTTSLLFHQATASHVMYNRGPEATAPYLDHNFNMNGGKRLYTLNLETGTNSIRILQSVEAGNSGTSGELQTFLTHFDDSDRLSINSTEAPANYDLEVNEELCVQLVRQLAQKGIVGDFDYQNNAIRPVTYESCDVTKAYQFVPVTTTTLTSVEVSASEETSFEVVFEHYEFRNILTDLPSGICMHLNDDGIVTGETCLTDDTDTEYWRQLFATGGRWGNKGDIVFREVVV